MRQALTRGTAIAATPIPGDFAAAVQKPEFRKLIRVAPPTVTRPESTPANARPPRTSIRNILHEPCILTENSQDYRRGFDKDLARKSQAITPVLEIGRTDMITATVAQNNMISYLPDFVSKPLVQSGALCYLDMCDMEPGIRKQLIYHKKQTRRRRFYLFRVCILYSLQLFRNIKNLFRRFLACL